MGVLPGPLATRAPAKINLTLHVLGRRADGYHELESLVAFAEVGDSLELVPGPNLALEVDGPTAPLAGSISDNLVLKAARLLQERVPRLQTGTFRLTKRLPVAAGLGGGSSDAAAALRLLAALNGLSLDDAAVRDAARLAGADVPVCLEGRARVMRGIGDVLGPPLSLPSLFAVLVNPGVPVPTPAVFGALGLSRGAAFAAPSHDVFERLDTTSELVANLVRARNDLEPPALRIEPLVAEALHLVAQTAECRLARMTGSGGTVFGLFSSKAAAQAAADAVRSERPNWWVEATTLA